MNNKSYCDGKTRRDILRLGVAGVLGHSFSLPNLLANDQSSKSQKSLIYVFLHGGLSTIDTFDMKPDAPAEYRGEFKHGDTAVPGIRICDQLPSIGKQMNKLSLIRSFRHNNSDHGPADHYMLTGYFPQAGFNGGLSPNNHRPSIGSIISKLAPANQGVPPYVCVPKMHSSCGPAYLGPTASPFVVESDPNSPSFQVPDLSPPIEIRADRLDSRKHILERLDRFRATGEMKANQGAKSVSTFQQKAFDLMTSPETRTAFQLQKEKDSLRDEYGRNTLGQSCLLARRLVESGVRCVTIDHSNWDTHDNNFTTLKQDLLPIFDRAIASLFKDLTERGMLENTLVVVTGEFGRTPKINKNAGRDHWGPVFTVALGGGGIKGGVVVGKSDAKAEKPASDPYGPEDLFATICHTMGMNPEHEFITPDGRPIMAVNQGRKIDPLF